MTFNRKREMVLNGCTSLVLIVSITIKVQL